MTAPDLPGAAGPPGSAPISIPTASLGFCRMGRNRELKWALERAWRGDDPGYRDLLATARELRRRHWRLQADRNLTWVPTGDFSLYDHVLDAAVAVGATPTRLRDLGGLDAYFAMARGTDEVRPLVMTKWFDTNYHHLVPELEAGTEPEPDPTAAVGQLAEALDLGIPARPVVLGPVTLARLSRRCDGGDPMELVDGLIAATASVVTSLVAAGARALQVDEPVLVTDIDGPTAAALQRSCRELRRAAGTCEVTVATYFGGLGPNRDLALGLDADFLHVDLTRDRSELPMLLAGVRAERGLSLGVVDGRNVWRSDLQGIVEEVEQARARLGPDRISLAPSCSLLHLPMSLEGQDLDPELTGWMAFATERLDELSTLARALQGDADALTEAARTRAAVAARVASPRTHDPVLRQLLEEQASAPMERPCPLPERTRLQRRLLPLPPLPTTTIGSFPQTPRLRGLRARRRRGEIDQATYDSELEADILDCVRRQEELGLDVLVHGEPERTDMVEYFAQYLDGFATTAAGWVQSYGSRCVRPPILFGDVRRREPMTVRWTSFAARLTDRPVKAMLTGPVTMLAWSFVRDDQPEADTATQVAMALRDEVVDLAAAGHLVIQIDEPALREALPLRAEARPGYLGWAARSFRLAAGGAPPEIAIHTHMCYSAFDEILDAVSAMDADVVSFEAARSQMSWLDSFSCSDIGSAMGPGVWDVHSPHPPQGHELDEMLDRAVSALGVERVWVNPDCGLKTRAWPEVSVALAEMVAAARRARRRHGEPDAGAVGGG